MQRILTGLLAALALVGCSVPPPVAPSPPALTVTAEPADGQPLSELGFTHAPPGFAVPRGAAISDLVDSANNITVVMTAPAALEVAEFYRRSLPGLGFTITADAGNSLLFEGGGYEGAFTVSDGYSAVTLRTDR